MSNVKKLKRAVQRERAARMEHESDIIDDVLGKNWEVMSLFVESLTRRQCIVLKRMAQRRIAELDSTEQFEAEEAVGLHAGA
ncbi:MAG: hypothetical protein KDA51_05335 [Planctomycetales bacterium]|nr:hypothetical protein [Planctomycetales bacterium]